MDVFGNVEFLLSAHHLNQLPVSELPEVAFAGRSNVGKSSLINTLIGRKSLVKVSARPGKTQGLNYFQVEDRFFLVDLPGYGFAKVPLEVKKQWGPMMQTYLSSRANLRGVVLIIDVRRIPKDEDIQMFEWLRTFGIPPILVVTKCDKVSKSQRERHISAIASELGVKRDELCSFSALSRDGSEGIWKRIERLLAPEADAPLSG